MIRFRELPADKVEQFIIEYYAGGKVKEPLEALGVKENFKHIHEVFPPEALKEKCEYCGKNLLKKRLARNNTDEEAHKASVYCPECNHRPKIEKCDCEKCRKRPERIEEERRKTIEEYWGKERDKIKLSDLCFRGKVFLGIVLKTSSTEDINTILPLENAINKVAPSGGNLLWAIANSLCYSNYDACVPSIDAPIDSFVLDEGFPKHYYPTRMKFKLNIETDSFSLYRSLTMPTYYNSKLASDALQLWTEIASYECMEYLDYQLNLFSIEHKLEKKTIANFCTLLKDFSVSQIYTIIWECVSDEIRDTYIEYRKQLAEFEIQKIEGEDSSIQFERIQEKIHALKERTTTCDDIVYYIIQNCMQYIYLSDTEKSRIGYSDRIDALPQSEISSFFFNQVVKIGDNGFYHAPNMKDLGVN